MVNGAWVTEVAILAVNVISSRPMTETSAVSVIRLTRWFPKLGSAMRQACGSRTKTSTAQGRSPSARAASSRPRATPRKAPRKLSVAGAPAISASASDPAQKGGRSTRPASGSTMRAMAVKVTALPKSNSNSTRSSGVPRKKVTEAPAIRAGQPPARRGAAPIMPKTSVRPAATPKTRRITHAPRA